MGVMGHVTVGFKIRNTHLPMWHAFCYTAGSQHAGLSVQDCHTIILTLWSDLKNLRQNTRSSG